MKIDLNKHTDAELGAIWRALLIADAEATLAPRRDKAVKAKAKKEKAEEAMRRAEPTPEVLAGFKVNERIAVPDLECPDSLDIVAPPTVRSPYNKARFALGDKATLPTDITYRDLMPEHVRLAALVKKAPKKKEKKNKPAKAAQVAVDIDLDAKAKTELLVATVMEVKGCTEAEAQAILASL